MGRDRLALGDPFDLALLRRREQQVGELADAGRIDQAVRDRLDRLLIAAGEMCREIPPWRSARRCGG
jgi:hypothetical protein